MKGATVKRSKLAVPDLHSYVHQVQQYGPEEVMEVATRDQNLSDTEKGSLKAMIESKLRTHKFKDGSWIPTRQHVRVCEGCGLDLGASAGPRRRFHSDNCRMKAARKKAEEAFAAEARGGVS
jgi:hypothetical protein